MANVDRLARTPTSLMHAKTVDYIADSQSEFDPPEVLLSPTLAPGESWGCWVSGIPTATYQLGIALEAHGQLEFAAKGGV